MRGLWTFIGGVAVGILAVTGVFATEEETKPNPINYEEDDTEELEDDVSSKKDDEN